MNATAPKTSSAEAEALVIRAEQAAPRDRPLLVALARRHLDRGRSSARRSALYGRLDALAPRTDAGRSILGSRPYPGHGPRMRLAAVIEGELAALALLDGEPAVALRSWLRAAVADLVAACRYASIGERGERERARLARVIGKARAAGVEVSHAAPPGVSAVDERAALARELGVDLATPADELKRRLRALAREAHPDLGGSHERMVKVNRLRALVAQA